MSKKNKIDIFDELLKKMEVDISSAKKQDRQIAFYKNFEVISYENEKRLSTIGKNDFNQKDIGAYYTPNEISKILISDMAPFNIDTNKLVLEPCLGLGALYFAFLDEVVSKSKKNKLERILKIINNSLLVEIDLFTVELFEAIFKLWALANFDKKIDFPVNNLLCKDFILENDYILEKANENFGTGYFDIIVTNPPYKILKPHNSDSKRFIDYSKKIRNYLDSSDTLTLQSGIPNLYKIIIEIILKKYSKKKTRIGLVLPSGILKDLSSAKLRKEVLNIASISNIRIFKESQKKFGNASIEFTTFSLDVGNKNEKISFYDNINKTKIVSDKSLFDELSSNFSLYPHTLQETNFLKSLSNLPRIKDDNNILNLRGEIDLTLNKDKINENNNGLKLYKGRNINSFNHTETNYFHPGLNSNSQKKSHSEKERIACQQISNSEQYNRMKWCFFEKNVLLSNSCNYIIMSNKKNKKSYLYFLLGILNSKVINHYFKLNSYNNHISNEEISMLPLPNYSEKEYLKIVSLTKKLINEKDIEIFNKLREKLDSEIYNLYFSIDDYKELVGVI